MSDALSHLTVATAKALTLPNDERIERIRKPRWIGYPRSKVVLDKLEDLLVYPKMHRMPNLLIVGDTNINDNKFYLFNSIMIWDVVNLVKKSKL